MGYFPVPGALVRKVQEIPKRLWRVEEDFTFISDLPEVRAVFPTGEIVVRKGTVSDGCSVPEAPIVYMLAGGKAFEAGLTHDSLYDAKPFPREVCDEVLREAVLAMGYDEGFAQAFYEAVRVFGASHWH